MRATAIAIIFSSAIASAEPPVRLPPGTRADPNGQLVSGRGLRDTTDFVAKEIARGGIAAHQVGPYRVRAVEITRFVSETPRTPWLAIHIVRVDGKTLILFVARPSS